jgi:hypothetical protein
LNGAFSKLNAFPGAINYDIITSRTYGADTEGKSPALFTLTETKDEPEINVDDMTRIIDHNVAIMPTKRSQ